MRGVQAHFLCAVNTQSHSQSVGGQGHCPAKYTSFHTKAVIDPKWYQSYHKGLWPGSICLLFACRCQCVTLWYAFTGFMCVTGCLCVCCDQIGVCVCWQGTEIVFCLWAHWLWGLCVSCFWDTKNLHTLCQKINAFRVETTACLCDGWTARVMQKEA